MNIYKYQPINQNTLNGLNTRKLWAARPHTFNDPFEFKLKRSSTPIGLKTLRNKNPHLENLTDEELIVFAIDRYEVKIREMGVICYTMSPDNILMWSHYADGHKGICLEFKLDEGRTLSDAGIYKVVYDDIYPEIDFENIWHKDRLAKILWTKSKEWASENELRQIRISGNELVDYPFKLSSILFGLKTSDNEKKLIKRILEGNGVEFKNIKLADREFKLQIT
jgi:hypothetical protein